VPSVLVVPVYVEISAAFERSLPTLEQILRRAGYAFCVGEPMSATIDTVVKTLRNSESTYGGSG